MEIAYKRTRSFRQYRYGSTGLIYDEAAGCRSQVCPPVAARTNINGCHKSLAHVISFESICTLIGGITTCANSPSTISRLGEPAVIDLHVNFTAIEADQ